jgi:hypothetical protein
MKLKQENTKKKQLKKERIKMESNDLKITAGSFIVESDLTKSGKIQMLKFIRHEASDHQLMALLLDGEIVDLDEQAEQIVEDRFMVNEKLTSRQKDFLPWVGFIHRAFGECAKKCGRITLAKEKRLCKQRCTAKRDEAILKAKTAKKQKNMNAAKLAKSQAKVAGRQ